MFQSVPLDLTRMIAPSSRICQRFVGQKMVSLDGTQAIAEPALKQSCAQGYRVSVSLIDARAAWWRPVLWASCVGKGGFLLGPVKTA